MNQTSLLSGNIRQQILTLAVPLLLGNILQQLYNTADSLIVGRFLGTNAFASVGISGSLMNLFIFILDGFEVDFLQTEEVGYRCACSREKVERALISLGKTELSKMIEEQDKSEVTCQFCDKIYEFTRLELQKLLAHASEKK